MLDLSSPPKSKCIAGRHGAVGDSGVTLGRRSLAGLWQIAGWDEFGNAATLVLRGLGLAGLGDYRYAQTAGGVTAWRIAPDKVLFEGAGDLSSHASNDLVVLDLGHARTVITLQGPAARDLLAQVIAIDTAMSAFGEGEFLQTGIHHVGVLIHCTGPDCFEILVPGTWAETVWDLLFDNALPHGLTVTQAP